MLQFMGSQRVRHDSAIELNQILDLIDRVPEELWMEVRNMVQEAGIKTIPRKRNAKKKGDCVRRSYKYL